VNLVDVHDMDLTSVGKRCLPRWAVATLGASDALVLLSPGQGEYLHREEQVGCHPWSRTEKVVISNGVVTMPLPDKSERAATRAGLSLSADDFVVGIVARLSPQKAHHVLFETFAGLREGHSHARLVVADDSKLRKRLGVSARSPVQQLYRIEETARRYEDLLVSLLGAR
jgi:glycosyltransferase involved in cell wall biosynthesis